MELTARTAAGAEAGRDRRAARRGARESRGARTTATAATRSRASRALPRRGYLAAPVPAGAGRPRRELRARRRRRLGPAGPRRRVRGDRRQHAPRRRAEPRAPLADGARRRRGPPRGARSPPRCATIAARRRRARGRAERAGPGPHAARRREAARTADGWRIDGHKIFCTMSPAATALLTSVRFVDDDGVERYGYVQIPRRRARRARSTTTGTRSACAPRAATRSRFDGVELPASALRGGFPAGDAGAVPRAQPDRRAVPRLGVARHRRGGVRARRARPERIGDDARARMLVAEAAIDLAAARAALSRAAALIDEHHARNPADDGTDEEIVALFAEAQAAKTFINEAASRVVDRALALSGGAGYLNGSPLARAYRDVRAGAFMHPLGANRAYEFLGDVALGRPTRSAERADRDRHHRGRAGRPRAEHAPARGRPRARDPRARARGRALALGALGVAHAADAELAQRAAGRPAAAGAHGYLGRAGLLAHLEAYAARRAGPRAHDRPARRAQPATATSSAPTAATGRRRNVVIATGDCDVRASPPWPPPLRRPCISCTPRGYRRPDELPDGWRARRRRRAPRASSWPPSCAGPAATSCSPSGGMSACRAPIAVATSSSGSTAPGCSTRTRRRARPRGRAARPRASR